MLVTAALDHRRGGGEITHYTGCWYDRDRSGNRQVLGQRTGTRQAVLDWAGSVGADEIEIQEPTAEALAANAATYAAGKVPSATTPPIVPAGGLPDSVVWIMAVIDVRATPGVVDYWHASWQDNAAELGEFDGDRDEVIAWARTTRARTIWLYDIETRDVAPLD